MTELGQPVDALRRAASPVVDVGAEAEVEAGLALCLSGGGYRAMLFHVGALWRLNELGYLQQLERVSSVSGGSITAGVLALGWKDLRFDSGGVARAFEERTVEPVRALARLTVDVRAIVLGLLLPGSIGNRVAKEYERRLFGEATLQALPDRPRFVFNATSLQSGVLWRFSKPYMRDYRVGEVPRPRVSLALAVAASSAFPPFLSPVVLGLRASDFADRAGEDLQREPFTTRAVLTDGGVYDNLGLETVWKRYRTILVSDGGGKMGASARPRHMWPFQTYRVLSTIDNQVRSLRKRQTIDGYRAGLREGAYWGIRSDIADYGLPDSLPCPHSQTLALADVRTRLARLEEVVQERLINWGYAVCDAALRAHVNGGHPRPADFPYPAAAVGDRRS